MNLFGGKNKAVARRKTPAKRTSKKRTPAKRATRTPAKRKTSARRTSRKATTGRKVAKRTPAKRTPVSKRKAVARSPAKRPPVPRGRPPAARSPAKRPPVPRGRPPVAQRPPVSYQPHNPRFNPPVSAPRFVRKTKFRTKSPDRRRGHAITNDQTKNIYFLNYMIDNGQYGKDVVCSSLANLYYDAGKGLLEPTESAVWSILQCPYKMVAMYLTISFAGGGATHANMLIINKNQTPWEIERFEPHGSSAEQLYDMYAMDSALRNFFSTMMTRSNIQIDYKGPMEVCPRMGPQTRAEKDAEISGLCQTWVLWYLDARLTNPHLTGKEILDEVFQIPPEELYEMVQDYVHFVVGTVVPQSEIDLIREKKGLSIAHRIAMETIRGIEEFSTGEKDELSLLFYDVIAKVEDIEMGKFSAQLIAFMAKGLENHFDGPRKYLPQCRQLLKAIAGRTVPAELQTRIKNVLTMMQMSQQFAKLMHIEQDFAEILRELG